MYEVVATDNAGNSTTTTIRLYRRHRVLILSDRNDPSSAILHLGVPHGFELELPFDHLPKEAYFVDLDNENIKIYREENNEYNFGIISSNRTFLQVIPETELPTLELGLRSRRFWGYHADSESDFCYADMPSKTEEGYLMDIRVTSNKIGYYFGSPVRYTQEQLKALDAEGKIKWTQFDTTSLLTFDVISYEEYNGSWYYYAKATNEVGTRYVSTPNIIIDADPAVALEYPSGKELTGKYGQTESGTYWGDLQFTVVDESEFTVKDGSTPLEPDENGVYTIKADMDEGIKHEIVIMDAGNNRTAYINEIRMNTLDRRDNPSALNLPNGANLEESLPKTVRILTARDSSMFTNIPVIWEIPETYEQASKREQSFTVNGTLDLSGTDIVLHPDKTELGKAQISVTIAGAPRYTLTIADSANGSITVVNATETAEDGKPLFFKDELVMLSIAPDEGYMLSALSVNGIPATVAVGDDTYTFAQPEENVTITATFEKRNEHTVTFDANGGSEPEDLPEEVTTAMPAKKVLHGSEYYLPECEFVAPEGKQFKAWQIDGTEYPVNAPVTVTADITVKALWKDSEKPTGEIKISENSWKAFLNNITFGLFFKDTQTVTITAADNSGEAVTVEYLLSDKELTKAELDGKTFTAYTAPFGIDPDNEYIIYVKLTDTAGNTDCICSDGIVLDGTSPVITGIENGKTYCAAQTVTTLLIAFGISAAVNGYLAGYIVQMFRDTVELGHYGELLYWITVWLTAVCAVISTYAVMCAFVTQRTETQALRLHNQLILDGYRAIESKMRASEAIRHEERHRIVALESAYKKGDYETLGKMLQDMRGQCEHLAQTHFSKNFVVNAILQDAAYRAARAGISFDATASVSAEIPISENELCALLMNMLDNAIEAASRCTEKSFIRFKAEERNGFLAVKCENSFIEEPKQDKNGQYISTKDEKESHGFGLKLMNAVAEKYHSMLDIFISDENVFTVQTALRIPKK